LLQRILIEEATMKKNEKKYRIRRVCAWCGKLMGYKRATQPGDTHGICKECEKRMMIGEDKWR
jgi:hypothetical protein